MKKIDPLLMSDVISQICDNNPDFHEKLLEVKAKNFCKDYFKNIGKYIDSIEIKDSVLRLRVNSSNMKQYIIIDKNNIIDNINEYVGVCLIRDISVI